MLKLRPFQREALRALEEESHLICIAPTGAGKSLIYERMAIQPGFRTLLVTPLVALARQQHRKLLEAGVDVRLGTGHPKEPPPERSSMSGPGAWIVSPETLLYENRRRELREWRPNFLVVDECHCLWDWGERFRPAFNHLPRLIRDYPIRRSLWLTATLPSQARDDLVRQLPLPVREIGSFALPSSLHLEVARVPWAFRTEAMIEWLSTRPEAGVIFVPTRANTEKLSRLLVAAGRKVLAYHAGMGSEERRAIEQAIERRECDAVVATSAFGMGMDHSHLRWVMLWQAPSSLLSLTQAIGRAGRDLSRSSHALIMWEEDDFRLLEWTVGGSERRRAELLAARHFLSSVQCREQGLSEYFGNSNQRKRCTRCDFCSTSQISF